MKYKNTTPAVIYLKDGRSTRAVSPGEEFETENFIGISGISTILPPKKAEKPVVPKPHVKSANKIPKQKETLNVRNTDD